MKKKIVMYLGYYYPNIGGVQMVVSELVPRLTNCEFDVTIVTCNTENVAVYEVKDGIAIFRLPCWHLLNNTFPVPKPNLSNLHFFFNQWKSDFQVIITHTRFYPISFLGFLISKLKHIPLLHVEHGSQHSVSNNPTISLANQIYDHTFGFLIVRFSFQNICISQRTMDFVKHLGGKRNILIHNGIDDSKFHEVPSVKYSINPEEITITFIGRLIYAKGIQDLLSITPQINSNVKILIIGDGPYKSELLKLSETINTDKIIFLGEKGYHEIPQILSNTDIFINPSYSEGLPTAVMEAFAAGCATIATDVGGTNEIIDNGINGFLYFPGDCNALVQKINYLIDHVEIREKFGQEAQKKISREFAWDIVTKKWLIVLSSALYRKKRIMR